MSNSLAKILGMGGGGVDVWASGATVRQYAYVISPTDMEIYQRRTATGSGTTDPLSDTTNYRAVSYDRAAVSVNAWSAADAPWTTVASVADQPNMTMGISTTLSASVGTRTLMTSATGRGVLEFAGGTKASGGAAPTQKTRLELIIDGRVIFDFVTIPTNSAGPSWMLMCGTTTGGAGSTVRSAEAHFSTGFQIYYTNIVATQAAKLYCAYRGLEP